MSSTDQKVIEVLDGLGITYEIIPIDPEFADTVKCCEKYGFPLEHSCNTIIVVSKKGSKKYAACVVLAHTRLDVNKRVKKLLEVPKVSFASADEMMVITSMEVGGVTPFSLPKNLPLYVDKRIMDLEWVILGGGSRSIKVKTSSQIFVALGAEIILDLAIASPR